MENKSKVETFIGFSIRTGKFRIGLNAVLTLKRINLLLVCKSISQNSLKKAKSIANKYGCKLLISSEKLLDEFTHKENSKIMAIADAKLANAILLNKEQHFIEISLEN